MRKPVLKELDARFRPQLGSRLPMFVGPNSERDVGEDSTVWSWEIAPALVFFIMLQPFDREDQFTIEIGWSDDGQYPWKEDGPRYFKVENARARRRLTRLWSTEQCEPVWEIVRSQTYEETSAQLRAMRRGDREEVERIRKLTDVSIEEAVRRIAALVDDAIQKLVDYGLPFFHRVADQRGIPWPAIESFPGFKPT